MNTSGLSSACEDGSENASRSRSSCLLAWFARLQDSGIFRAWGLEFRVQGLWGLGFRGFLVSKVFGALGLGQNDPCDVGQTDDDLPASLPRSLARS